MTILVSTQIGAAGTTATDAVTDLGKIASLTIQARFVAGSGGTSVKAYVQTLVDATNWYDIACFAFTTSNASEYMACVMSGVNTPVALTDGALTDDTSINGLIGTSFRVKYVVVGTYTGATLAVDISTKN
jgi:hypothetical protein